MCILNIILYVVQEYFNNVYNYKVLVVTLEQYIIYRFKEYIFFFNILK